MYSIDRLQCNTIREFDTEYTIKMFNYTNVYRYYEDATLSNKLHLINVPCLCLSAADDPFLYFRGTSSELKTKKIINQITTLDVFLRDDLQKPGHLEAFAYHSFGSLVTFYLCAALLFYFTDIISLISIWIILLRFCLANETGKCLC